jgi:rare lipoprotein A
VLRFQPAVFPVYRLCFNQETIMRVLLASLLLTLSMLAATFVPASAEPANNEWWQNTFRNSATPTAANRSQRQARAPRAETPAARTARTVDDGSRPQRQAAVRPTPSREPAITGNLSGVASYYWQPQPVASGGRFNPDALTAAHKTLPFGTRVRVTHAGSGRSVEVVINDRGPYIGGRIIDLSRRAAQVIGMTDQGIARVNVAILGR